MKNILILFIMILCVGVSYAEKPSKPIPVNVEKSLYRKFPQLKGDAIWVSLENGLYEADFTYEEKNINALFSPLGNLVGICIEVKWFDMPVKVRKYVYDNFEGNHLNNIIIKYQYGQDTMYLINLDYNNHNYDLEFDAEADLIKLISR